MQYRYFMFFFVDGLHAHANKSQAIPGTHTHKMRGNFPKTRNGKNKTDTSGLNRKIYDKFYWEWKIARNGAVGSNSRWWKRSNVFGTVSGLPCQKLQRALRAFNFK